MTAGVTTRIGFESVPAIDSKLKVCVVHLPCRLNQVLGYIGINANTAVEREVLSLPSPAR